MAKNKVEIVNMNTSDLKVLSHKDMITLFKRIKDDQNAKEELIIGNLKLVLSILKKYTNRTDNMDDLFQVGCIGLIKAIDNFDLKHKVKFSTYAVPMILGEIKRYLRDNNSCIRISRSIKDLAYKALKEKEFLTNKYNREISIPELAKYMNVNEEEIVEAIEATYDTVSIFEPIFNDGGETIYLCDQLKDQKNSLYPIEYYIALKEALKKLKEKERYIINERYIFGKTQMELAQEIGISQAQISRLEKNGIESLKRLIK